MSFRFVCSGALLGNNGPDANGSLVEIGSDNLGFQILARALLFALGIITEVLIRHIVVPGIAELAKVARAARGGAADG